MIAKFVVAFILGVVAGVTGDRVVSQVSPPHVSPTPDSELRSIQSRIDAVLRVCKKLADESDSGTRIDVPTQTAESAVPAREPDMGHSGDDLVAATRTALENVRELDDAVRALLQQLPSANTGLEEMLVGAPPVNHDELARFNQEYGELRDKRPAAEELFKSTPSEILKRFGRPSSWTPDSWTWNWRSNVYRRGQFGSLTIQFLKGKPIVKVLESN